ncbi:MAG: flagellar biosynthetic protein FliQ [Phycisphaerales bacterium]|nr:flagellar biosynthetic protein FliQ [Phycisphaerales bacterium]
MLVVSSPILLGGLLIGLIVSLFQAVTQIQEQTLSFVPKIIVMTVLAIMLAPWMGRMVMEFAHRMFAMNN